MSAEKPGDNVDLQLVAKADSKYENAGGMRVLFHQCPTDSAPWIGKTHSGVYLKKGDGQIIQVGQIDSKYRVIGKRKGLMTKGMSKGEVLTGDAEGTIYRLRGEKTVESGDYDRRWVTPVSEKQRLILPLMMSRKNGKHSPPSYPWIGEFGGVIYVEVVQK
jgi:hypothetical protein